MNCEELVSLALEQGFANAAVVETKDIPFVPGFRICCEDNTCGKYGANYSCPPDCGSPADMEQKAKSHRYALLLQTMWQMDDAMDSAALKTSKGQHNRMVRRLIDQLSPVSHGIMVGASGCNLCNPCAITAGEPCRFPDKQFSCMSAYCVYVEKLAEDCGMEYDSGPGIVNFFGMYLFDWNDAKEPHA